MFSGKQELITLSIFFFIADVCKFSDILADVYDSSSRVGHSRQATYKFLS